MSQLFPSGGQNIGVSASTSVLPLNTQDWFPLGCTGCISLQSKGLSRVFSNTSVQKHHFFGAQLSFNFMAAVTTCSDFGAPQNSLWLFPLFLQGVLIASLRGAWDGTGFPNFKMCGFPMATVFVMNSRQLFYIQDFI